MTNALTPWKMKGLRPGCGLFVAGPYPNILGFLQDSLLASVSPLLYTPVFLPSTVLSTSGLSRNTQLLSQFLGLRFFMNRRLTLELKTWISAQILLFKLLYSPLF